MKKLDNKPKISIPAIFVVIFFFILEPVSKLSIKEIENNNSAREVKRSHIIFRFSLPTYENGSESIVPTVGSFNDPSSRLSFVFTDQWFLASSSNVRPDISSSN
ncbi:hypothetical protein LEP1GSC179_3105 [Leptospira santarosai str. MOR084]|uniref:Uncharacterized protein n=1 Tax=Leptospira santarosai str. MOR084 TaxID=1049984 RepID=A0A0E2BC61_9LEPT|nr:hypothetical protein LEP1GSC179_3105 [Leptospira santarosai str. MOR084]